MKPYGEIKKEELNLYVPTRFSRRIEFNYFTLEMFARFLKGRIYVPGSYYCKTEIKLLIFNRDIIVLHVSVFNISFSHWLIF